MRPGSFENLTANKRLLPNLIGISEFDKTFSDPYLVVILPDTTRDCGSTQLLSTLTKLIQFSSRSGIGFLIIRYKNRHTGLSVSGVHRILQCLAGLEAGHTSSFDFDGRTGLRVTSCSGSPALGLKGAEAYQYYGVILFQ
jgi:hypothetical protein